MDIDIDMVFTYVDGYDPKFIKMKNNYLNNLNKKYNPDIRSKGLNEIIYSVNSVIKFIPWIRKIFIVTNNQIPPIDSQLISSGKVIIIDQNTIIDPKYLPTFNSDVIESYLHNIPDLSEIFLYNNDDMMHLRNIDRKDIYEVRNNKILLKIRNNFNKNKPVNDNEYSQRLNYTKNLFLSIDPNTKFVNNHHTKILRKSTMKYIDGKFTKLLSKMRINHVRGTGYIQYLFFNLNVDNILHNNIIINYGNDVIEKHFGNKIGDKTLFNDILQKRPKFICLNSMNQSFSEIFPQIMNEIL
jgi:ribosome-associated toxin RatA of RatAB toxin-antitoxin module